MGSEGIVVLKKQERKELRALYSDMKQLRREVFEEGNALYATWEPSIRRPSFKASAKNLAHYLALRRRDVRPLQERLSDWGLSSLGRAESKVLPQMDNIIRNLALMTGEVKQLEKYPFAIEDFPGRKKLTDEADRILGSTPKNRSTRIMVTLSSQAAEDKDYLVHLLESGMGIARINCAHDDAETWQRMVAYLQEAQKKTGKNCKVYFDIAGPKVRVQSVISAMEKPRLKVADTFFLTAATAVADDNQLPLVLRCNNEELVQQLKVGDAVILDDGTLDGRVIERKPEGVIVQVEKTAKTKGIKVKAEKGLNFPDTAVEMPLITQKDRQDIQTVQGNADMLGFSFVKGLGDIRSIQAVLAELLDAEKAEAIPLILKIETVKAVDRLPELIVAAASKNPLAIMIARGDLAAEAGFLRLPELQEEILWICEAAHIPVIWSTQVLENMVKTGIPTRAEMTDATMAGQAECVMLNKGEFLNEAITLLDAILTQTQNNQTKKSAKLRSLKIAEKAWKKAKK